MYKSRGYAHTILSKGVMQVQETLIVSTRSEKYLYTEIAVRQKTVRRKKYQEYDLFEVGCVA